MKAGIIVGAAFCVAGMICILAANIEFWRVREELVAKRPDLMDFAFGGMWWFGKYRRLSETIQRELPENRRHRRSWIIGIIGAVCWMIGGSLLMKFLG